MEKPFDQAAVEQIIRAVHARLGSNNPQAANLIAQEVAAAVAASQQKNSAGQGAAPGSTSVTQAGSALSGLPPKTSMPVEMAGGAPEPEPGERIVVSANGRNRSGIVAALTTVVSEFQADIRDISQTVAGDYFTMLIVVDIGAATRRGRHFSELKDRLQQTGTQMGVHVVALHDDLLTSMHSV